MNKLPTIAITGAGGFIGSFLVDHFIKKGWQVMALLRKIPAEKKEGVLYIKYDLALPMDATVLKGADYVLHAAYVASDAKNTNAYELNLRAAEEILKASAEAGIRKNIFISSLSALPEALSVYGRQKYAIEKLFSAQKDVIIRPGLVIGDGGLLRNIVKIMRSSKVIPLIGGGNQPLQIIHIGDLLSAIDKIIDADLNGTFILAHPGAYTFRSFYKMIANRLKIKPVFIPVPFLVPRMLIGLAGMLGIRLSITKDNLLGLKKMRYADPAPDLERLELKPCTLEEALDRTRLEE